MATVFRLGIRRWSLILLPLGMGLLSRLLLSLLDLSLRRPLKVNGRFNLQPSFRIGKATDCPLADEDCTDRHSTMRAQLAVAGSLSHIDWSGTVLWLEISRYWRGSVKRNEVQHFRKCRAMIGGQQSLSIHAKTVTFTETPQL